MTQANWKILYRVALPPLPGGANENAAAPAFIRCSGSLKERAKLLEYHAAADSNPIYWHGDGGRSAEENQQTERQMSNRTRRRIGAALKAKIALEAYLKGHAQQVSGETG